MLNYLSAALTLAGCVPYIRAILRGETRPNRVSWWIWCTVGLLLLSSYYSLGSQAALGLAAGSIIGQLTIALLSLKYGSGGTTTFDRFCLAGALFTGLLWWLTASPFLPHILTVLLDFFGWLPTFRKTLREPNKENAAAWMFWTAAAAVALVNVQFWTVSNVLFPVYIVVSDSIVTILILRHRGRRTKKTAVL